MKRRTIKVRGGVLYADLKGAVISTTRWGKPIRIERVYYAPDLGANLLSSRRLCMPGMKGQFDSDSTYLHIDGKDMLKATHQEGAYVLIWTSSKFLSVTDQSNPHVTETVCAMIPLGQTTLTPSWPILMRRKGNAIYAPSISTTTQFIQK